MTLVQGSCYDTCHDVGLVVTLTCVSWTVFNDTRARQLLWHVSWCWSRRDVDVCIMGCCLCIRRTVTVTNNDASEAAAGAGLFTRHSQSLLLALLNST